LGTKVRATEHRAALPYADIPGFMGRLRGRADIAARALEFTIITAARVNEVVGASWDEIKEESWVVPAARIKGGREHRVPLPAAAIALLDKLPRGSERIFAGAYEKRLWRLVQTLAPGMTVHGFRSSFRDWAAEKTNCANHVVEMALAHRISSAVEAAYRRGDLFDKRRELMEMWSNYCTQPIGSAHEPGRDGAHTPSATNQSE
jgi:integrase